MIIEILGVLNLYYQSLKINYTIFKKSVNQNKETLI